MMSEVPPRDNLPRNDAAARALQIKTYREGELILAEGDSPSSFFVVLSGQIWIMQKGRKVRLLEEEDIFGLENMVFKKPSFYSARALTKSRVAAYAQEAFDFFLHENPRMTQNMISSILRQLLQTSQHVSEGADVFTLGMEDVEVRFFQDGEVIIQEGTSGDDFFRLVSTQGGLKVTIAGKLVNRIEKPGEFFGEMASLLKSPRQATVTSVGESVVEIYGTNKLELIVRDHPDTALQLIRTLASRLADISRRFAVT